MCDTLFVPAGAASSGSAFFGKNSDRNPDEPQVMTLASGPRWPSPRVGIRRRESSSA